MAATTCIAGTRDMLQAAFHPTLRSGIGRSPTRVTPTDLIIEWSEQSSSRSSSFNLFHQSQPPGLLELLARRRRMYGVVTRLTAFSHAALR